MRKDDGVVRLQYFYFVYANRRTIRRHTYLYSSFSSPCIGRKSKREDGDYDEMYI